MSEEIWDLTEARQRMYMQELERCKNEDCDFYLEHNDVNEFYDYITNLQEEIERLNNIINELEKWIKEDKECFETQFYMGRCVNFQCILDKLQELKGSDK